MHFLKRLLAAICFILLTVQVYGGYTQGEIEEASHAELRLIARSLGIDHSQTPGELREEILTLIDREPDEELEGRDSVRLYHAQKVSVMEEDGRRIIIFTGGVELRVQREDEILLSADMVMFDQERGMLFAHGFVEASGDFMEERESFTADTLLFSLDENTAAVAYFTTETEAPEEEAFYLSGKHVILHGKQHISVQDGILSTRKEDPYFSIHASKIDIMPSGDIAMRGARLYLGRVPVMYLPYFFYPSRTFIFHPIVGFDTERGFFSQNTLYISGRREPREEDEFNIFTFLQDAQEEDVQKAPHWYALTLSGEEEEAEEGFSRILVDVYSGTEARPAEVFTGYELYLPEAGNFDTIRIQGGVSFGEQRQAMDLDFDLPYEAFGGFFDVHIKYRDSPFSADLKLPYMTQRGFTRDFMNRFDYFSLDHLLEEDTEWPDEYRLTNSLLWELDTSYRKRFSGGDFVEEIHIRELSSSLNWRLSTTDGIQHFSPHTLTLPKLSYRLKGSLYSWESREEDPVERQAPGFYGEKVRTPFEDEQTEDLSEDQYTLREDRDIQLKEEKKPAKPGRVSADYNLDHDISFQLPVAEDDTLEDGRIISRLQNRIDTKAQLFDSHVDITSALRTRLNYYDHPFGETTDSDRDATSLAVLHDLRAAFPVWGVTYRMDVDLYHDQFLYDELDDRNIRTFAWEEEQFRRHELFYDYQFVFPYTPLTADARFTLQLPPKETAFSPRLRLTYDPFMLQGETKIGLEEPRSFLESKGVFTFDPSDSLTFTQNAKINHETDIWEGESKLDLSLFSVDTDHRLLFGNDYEHKNIGPYRLRAWYGDASLRLNYDWLEDDDDPGEYSYRNEHVQLRYDTELPDIRFWKNRIALSSGFATELTLDAQRESLNKFQFEAFLDFRIEEFLSLSFSSRSSHRDPARYLEDFPSLFSDLRDSFAFSDPQARRRSPFNIEAYEAELVHYMPDWNFHASLEGSIERIDDSWELVNRLQVYLQWKHIPELRFDEETEFN